MTDISPTLQGTIDYFNSLSDRMPGQPQTPFPKVAQPLSIISNPTANLHPRSAQMLVWDVYVTDLRRETVKQCTPKYVVYQCDCGRHIVPSSCMSKDCVICAPSVQVRTAESIFRRFMQYGQLKKLGVNGKTVLYTVFTIPPHQRDKFLNTKEIQKVRKKIWGILKTKFGACFGVEATHPVGSESDMFHPHLNFLWMQKKGFRPYIDVNRLNVEWANILDVRTVNVWHQYSDRLNQIYKWAEYVGRPFPGYSWWKGSIRWYGRYPKVLIKSDFICADCGCYYRRIGTISAIDVSDYYEHGWLMGLDPPWFNNSKLTLCRGSKKNGRTEHDERGVLRYEERKLSEASSDGVNRYGSQRSFA